MHQKRFAVLITGDPSERTRDLYGNYADLFIKLLKRDGEIWDVFDTRLNEYPENSGVYQGFVITGSASTAHEPLPWIEALKAYIQKLHAQNRRILGVCFGHQALAGALGGETHVNPKGWELGLHRLQWNTASNAAPMAESATLPTSVLEIHRDHVVKVPPGAEVLASTPSTPVQVFAMGNNILGVQGHPEFYNDIVEDLVIRRRDAGIISDEVATAALQSLHELPDRETWVRWLRSFLDMS